MNGIVLVSPPRWANSVIPPMSLIELAAYLRKHDTPVSIVDVKRPPTSLLYAEEQSVTQEIVEQVIASGMPWVGLPCYTVDYWQVVDLAKRLKERVPDLKIVSGNVHATAKPEDFFLPDSPFDAVCIGEGEETLLELVNSEERGVDWADIQGLAFSRNGRMMRTPSRPLSKDLSHLPRPAYDMVDMEYYMQPQQGLIRRLVAGGTYIYTARGCPFQCTYCASTMLYETQGFRRMVRIRPIEDVIETLVWLKKTYNMDSFYIYDDTFTMKKSRVQEFCQRYKEAGLNMLWACESRVNQVDQDLLDILSAANCIQMDFGVETGSDAALMRMKKGTKAVHNFRAFDLCNKNKMRTFANMMFNTPGETEEDVDLSLQCIEKIKATNLAVAITVPYLGTPDFNERYADTFTREDYHVYSDPNIGTTLLGERFRMSAHTMDLNKILRKLQFKYIVWQKIFPLTRDLRYWKMFLKSSRKRQYIVFYFSNLSYILRRYLFYVMNMIKKRMRSK